MVAYLEITDGNIEFHRIMDFLTRISIYYALTIGRHIVSTSFVEQFWTTAKSRTVNNTSYIDATVAASHVTNLMRHQIRSDLFLIMAIGIDSLTNQAIFDNIQLMGYEGDLNTLTFNKALFSPQWKFLFHTMNHCISSKSTSWDQIPTNIATAGKNFSGKVTPLFDSMLVQQTEDEGDASERPSDSPPIPSPPHPKGLVGIMEVMHPRMHPIRKEDGLITQRDVQEERRNEGTKKGNEGADKGNEGTDKQDEGTDNTKVSTDRQCEGTADQDEGKSVTQTAPTPTPTTPTPTVFGDDETIAQLCIDEEVARKVQEEWEAKEEKKRLDEEEATKSALSNEYDFIQARLNADKILC
ncbi:hypothetical protein Tco_0618271 [Tanacetum coccineum]